MDLLLVDDDDDFRGSIARRLARRGHRVLEARRPGEALELFEHNKFDVALFDLNMPEMSGIDLLQRAKQLDPDCPIVMLTGEGSIETAVGAMKLGAFDYLTKPCPFDELEVVLTKAHGHGRLTRENLQLRTALQRTVAASSIIGESPAIRKVLKLIEKAGPSNSPVLILGESGTGKELVARALHQASPRAANQLVSLNCAALPEALLESELFGHEKGAFTGATAAKMGLFEVADGGTLFIDEVGELAGNLQAKLLRVLQEGRLRRVGSVREQSIDVRVISATNRNLRSEVEAGRFRDDLYYRLSVLTLELPPLRDRGDDILLLVDHLLHKGGDAGWTITEKAMQALRRYSWPGNIRELANVIERARILAEGTCIDVDSLPEALLAQASAPPASRLVGSDTIASDDLEELEQSKVEEVLRRVAGNKAQAARLLGITRRSLYRLIEKYRIDSSGPGVDLPRGP